MTLIIGIKCSDGIVLGSDGAATLGAMGQFTVRQPTKKLFIHQDCIVVGVSGPVGLGQRIDDMFDRLYSGKELSGKKPAEAMTILRTHLWNECLAGEIGAAAQARNIVGDAANASALSQTLVALPVSRELCLFQFDQNGAPEMATNDLPFVAIGSGQRLADPFLAFLRRIFWKDRCPNVADGIFAVWWTLHQAIETAPGYVADPKQIVVLQNVTSKICARELTGQQLSEHAEVVGKAEDHLRAFRREQQVRPTPEVSPIPEPSKNG